MKATVTIKRIYEYEVKDVDMHAEDLSEMFAEKAVQDLSEEMAFFEANADFFDISVDIGTKAKLKSTGKCPKCNSTSLDYFDTIHDGEYLDYVVICNSCRTEFKECYRLEYEGILVYDDELEDYNADFEREEV